jgi:hypothetical protein
LRQRAGHEHVRIVLLTFQSDKQRTVFDSPRVDHDASEREVRQLRTAAGPTQLAACCFEDFSQGQHVRDNFMPAKP